MANKRPPQMESKASHERAHAPALDVQGAADWDLFESLLNDTAPAALRAALIPDEQRDIYLSALLAALTPGATFVRRMGTGETWKSTFTAGHRLSAIKLLGALRDECAVGPLIAQLDEPSNHVRIAIIMALGWIGGSEAIAALADMLDHPHDASRAEAARSLGRIGDPEASNSLAHALHDTVHGVRLEAARALARLEDPRAFGPLAEAFWKSKGVERDHILEELCQFDQDRTVRMLIQGRGPKGSERERMVKRALRKIRTPQAIAGLDEYYHRSKARFHELV